MEERLHVGSSGDRSEAEPMELLVRDGKAEALPCASVQRRPYLVTGLSTVMPMYMTAQQTSAQSGPDRLPDRRPSGG